MPVPKRTTPLQMIVHAVRKQTAQPGLTVTESKELLDAQLGEEREVDVVIEGPFDGEQVVTSIEVIEHSRPGDLPWVQTQIMKHRAMPTNRLVLVSKKGFTKNAQKAVDKEGGWVQALTPEVVERHGREIQWAVLDHLQLVPQACYMKVDYGGRDLDVKAGTTFVIHDDAGQELGMAMELGWEILNLKWVVPMFTQRARYATSQDELKGFALGMEIGPLGYHMHDERTDRKYLIKAILIEGDLTFQQNEISLSTMELGDRRLDSGEGTILGREGVWVATKNEATQITTVSWRMKDDKPIFEPSPFAGQRKFHALSQIESRVEWKDQAGPTGVAGLSEFD
jgi:hypothetical protein